MMEQSPRPNRIPAARQREPDPRPARQVPRSDQEEDDPSARPARPRAWRRSGWCHPRSGPAPIDAKNWPIGESATLGLPNRSEIHPRRIGELMSPNRWIRKMNDAYARGPPVGGHDVGRHGVARPENHRQQDRRAEQVGQRRIVIAGRGCRRRPAGVAASTAKAASSR